MSVSLTIVCSLERLTALDVYDAQKVSIDLAFGLNLSVGAEGSDKLDVLAPFLSPWLWKIDGVRLQWTASGTAKPPVDGTLIPQNPPALPALVTRLAKDLATYKTAKLLDQLRAPTARRTPASKPPDAADGTPTGPALPPWTPRLMHLATSARPTPAALNLSLLFRVNVTQLNAAVKPEDYFKIANEADRKKRVAADFAGDYAAAPVLAAAGPFDNSRMPNDAGPPSSGAHQGEWEYKSGSADAPVIIAKVAPIKFDPPKDGFVDMADQWIRHPKDAQVGFAEDWQARLEVRMAEAFRLPEFIAGYLRPPAPTDSSAADIGIALLADCAGLGLVGASAAQGNSFAERLFATVDRVDLTNQKPFTLTQDQWGELETLSHTLYSNLQDWKNLIGKVIPSLSNCNLLSSTPKALTMGETAVQFQRILDQVFSTRQDDKQADQVNLWALLQAQWETLLIKATKIGDPVKLRIRQALAAHASPPPPSPQPGAQIPRLYDIRTRLGLDNMDRFWNYFVASNDPKDPDGLNLVENCFPAFLQFYAYLRFGLDRPLAGKYTLPDATGEQALAASFTLPAAYVPKAPTGQRQALTDALRLRANSFKDLLRPQPNLVVTDDKVPQGLTFSLGCIAPDPAGSQTAASPTGDILESTSGFVILMREAGAQDQSWHCLNYAETWLAEKFLRTDPCIAPYRIHYRGNLKQALVTYNNKPLTADSPLNEDDVISGYFSSRPDYTEGFLRFRYCGSAAFADSSVEVPAAPDYAKTPGLKFGKFYQFAACALTNCGIPPKQVADGTGLSLATSIPGAAVPADAIIGGSTGLNYRRGVPVGGLRVTPVPSPNDPRVIPPDVTPRAREYASFDDGTGSPPPSSKVPLVLLAPNAFKYGDDGTKFAFDVRPPATPWDCWDRWVASDIGKDTRVSVISDIHRLTLGNTGKRDQDDTSIDDPAVHTAFWLELRRVQDDGTLEAVTPTLQRWVNFGAPSAAGDTLKAFQRTPVRVNCAIGGQAEIVSAGNGVEVHVKEGELYRLALFPAIPQAVLERFSGRTIDQSTPAYVLLPGSYFAIEVATALLPAATALWSATQCSYHIQPGTPSGKEAVRVDLSPFRVAAGDGRAANKHDVVDTLVNFRYIHRAVATHQAWRWTGRPIKRHPALKTPVGGEPDLRIWEAGEFGDRLPLESIPHPMAVMPTLTAERTADPLAWAADLRSFRFEITPSDSKGRFDQRGGHHRFKIQAWSRYEGLMTGKQTPSLVATDKDTPDKYEWKSLFMPSRRQDVLPPPKIKLILPLTQSEPEDSLLRDGDDLKKLGDLERQHRTAGLLVVLNEAWYETGGLGEEIEARVDLLPSPDNKDTTPDSDRKYFRQAGPDATVNLPQFKKDYGLLDTPVSAGDRSVYFHQEMIQGPVGHYFDADNTTALFVGTSFILPPPTLPAVQDPPTPWYMARVSFRRMLTAPTPPAGTAPDYPDASWQLATRYSDYTAPLWVQYLPEFSLFDKFIEQHVSALRLEIKDDRSLTLRDPKGQIIEVAATPSEDGVFTLYLVLTRMVSDVIGRPDQESYVTTFEQTADKTVWKTVANGETFTNQEGVYRARIIEVQRPNRIPAAVGCWKRPADYFWDQFFFTDDPSCDTPARIVRISEPVDQKAKANVVGA